MKSYLSRFQVEMRGSIEEMVGMVGVVMMVLVVVVMVVVVVVL